MNATHDRAKSIFLSAVEIASPEKRQTFVEAECAGDESLRCDVDELLRHQESLGSFLEQPAVAVSAGDHATLFDEPLAEGPGTVIGPYKLLQQIGEGGMGVVFVAEQERPVRRRVALKVIKPGMGTREVIARFEAERQALAMMDHPSIAKVYDAGTTGGEDGGQRSEVKAEEVGGQRPEISPGSSPTPDLRPLTSTTAQPYFVMELVQGVPITEYCDQCNLTTRERLELFIVVCQAVQHAHQKGVIHRDIKPTNILVAMQDGRPVPKIIDFGVAKAIDQPLTERTLMTAFAQMVGTPLYMSPEQAELSPLGVDTRCDIYSLGVLLYELLTGNTPFDKDRLHAATYDEMRRIIREEEPPRPSARISTLAADLATTTADHHRTDARRLKQVVRGDLDWIVMKCLEKDRNRRYDSAGSLARDVERYLHDEPVQACPPSIYYRLKKLVKRNKAAATVAAALLIGVLGLGFSNIAIKRERDAKTTALARAQTVSDLLQDMLASSNPDEVKGSQFTVRELLDNFSDGLDEQLSGQPEVEAEIRSVIGKSYWRLGVYDRAEFNSKKALDLRRQLFGPNDVRVADSLVDYAWNLAESGRNADAEKYVRQALSICQKHKSNRRLSIRALWSLQRFLISQSRFDESEEVANEALALAGNEKEADSPELPNILHALADAKSQQRNFAEAEKWARLSVDMHRRLHGNHHPETAYGLATLGRALNGQRKLAEAESTLRESLSIFREYFTPDHKSLQSVIPELKSVLELKGDRAALETLDNEEAERERRSDSAGYDLRVAALLIAEHSPSRARKEEGRRLIRRAIEAYGQAAIDHPDDLDRRLKAADGYVKLATICAFKPEFAGEVEETYGRLTSELTSLLADFPNSSACQWRCAMINFGWAAAVYGAFPSQEERCCREAIKLFEMQTPTSTNPRELYYYLATTNIYLGDALLREGRSDECEEPVRKGISIYEQHATEFEGEPAAECELAQSYIWLANFLASTKRQDEGSNVIRKASKQLNHAAEGSLDSARHLDALYHLAIARLRLADQFGYREACAAMDQVPVGNDNDDMRFRRIWVWCLGPHAGDDLALPLKQAREFAAANSFEAPYINQMLLGGMLYRASHFKEAIECLEESVAEFPSDPPLAFGTVHQPQLLLAMAKWRLGDRDGARRSLANTELTIDELLKSPSILWRRRSALEALRREAVGLIDAKEAEEAVESLKPKESSPTAEN